MQTTSEKEVGVVVSVDHVVGPIDRRIFGGFLEHLGRAVYGGVVDEDDLTVRQDVIDVLAPLEMPIVRYPGGNFVSAYDWRDGVGPVEDRPRRTDVSWSTLESNRFGTDEFMEWCQRSGTAPMLAVNLGTGDPSSAAALVEYCNFPGGTALSDWRRRNGAEAPHDVKLWCLGNEMDGPWQAGHMSAVEYARKASQAARLMKGVDPSIELVACGSAGRAMPTYLEWDRVVLEECGAQVEYISAHRYSEKNAFETPAFLAEGVEIDRVLDDYAGLISYVRGRHRSDHRVHVCFDEWNVWDLPWGVQNMNGAWAEAPPLLEQVYNLEDALVCAQYLSAFMRRADLVKVACLAQIVNVLAPVLTRKGEVLKQTIYHPFEMISAAARGVALVASVDGPTYDAGVRGDVPVIDVAVSYDAERSEVAIVTVNRSLTEAMPVRVDLHGLVAQEVIGSRELASGGLKTENTWEAPDAVVPVQADARIEDGVVRMVVPGPGLNVTRCAVRRG